MWPTTRARKLTQQCSDAFSKRITRFAVIPSFECDFIRYFPEDYLHDCRSFSDQSCQYVPISEGLANVDVVILTAHGSDLSAPIWDLRQKLSPTTLLLVWLWDNHLGHMGNLRTALAADFVFASHKYASGYLINPASALGVHIPACCGQWTAEEASHFFEGCENSKRDGRLLVNYVDYEFSARSQLLRSLRSEVPEADVLLMDPDNRSRYFGKSRAERFQDWAGHKSTLILPVDADLSTRVFDALLAGQILLVPKMISDFDEVIPPHKQAGLGIIRLPNLDITTIRSAIIEAEKAFDSLGPEGVLKRHRFVLEKHMLVHRIQSMLQCLRAIATKKFSITFAGSEAIPFGLHLSQPGK